MIQLLSRLVSTLTCPSWTTTRAVLAPPESVSSTEAKRILDCPALYKWSKENPPLPKAAFDFGHTVHGMVLGTGLDIYVHDHDSLRTKAAKEGIAATRERVQAPMSRADYARRRRLPGRLTNRKGQDK